MPICSFCGKSFANKGMMFVLSTGQVLYFCSSKCDKNHQLKRKGRTTKWTKTARDLKGVKKATPASASKTTTTTTTVDA